MTTPRLADRREFLRRGVAGGLGAAFVANAMIGPAAAQANEGGSEKLLEARPDHPEAATFDRLDEKWYKAAIRRLQDGLREEGIDAVLLTDRWNIIYFTGLFHTSTERPFAILIPAKGMDLTWFAPSLDRDLVKSWWIRDREIYFDFKHAQGGYPNEGAVLEGDAVDLTRWIWRGIRKRGYAGKVVGTDAVIDDSIRAAVEEVASKTTLKRAGDICMRLRMVKTPEEIALTQRAMNYWSRIHAWTRDRIIELGTDGVDFRIAREATSYGMGLIMQDIERDGRPHTAVGVSVGIGIRTGVGTAYPHPNQVHYNRIRKGDALQVAGIVRVGGYGGELYRSYQLAPWDAHREKVWDVHTECVRIQQEQSRAGVACSHVAKAVHDYQVKMGVKDLVYHRPAHGEGMEGHQPPYVALGDFTTMREGMMFSNEPGLYDPANGFGYNHSDNLLITATGSVPMGSVPLSKEWCFLKL